MVSGVTLGVFFIPCWGSDRPRSLAEVSSCLSAAGNESTQTRHLAPRCRPTSGGPCPDGEKSFRHKDTSLPLPWSHRCSCPGPASSKGAWKLGGGYAGPQIKLTLLSPCKSGITTKTSGGGEVRFSARHQLLSFSSFLTSGCGARCRCPFFSPPPPFLPP